MDWKSQAAAAGIEIRHRACRGSGQVLLSHLSATSPPVPRRARSDAGEMHADATLVDSRRFAMGDDARSDSDALGATGGVPASLGAGSVKRTKTRLVSTRATQGRGAEGAKGADAGGLTLADAQRHVDRRRAEARAEAVRFSTRPVAAHPPPRATTANAFQDDDAATWTPAGGGGVAPRVERAVDASGLTTSKRSYSNTATGTIALLTPASSMQDVRGGDGASWSTTTVPCGDGDPRGDESAAGECLSWREERRGTIFDRAIAHGPRRWRWWAVIFTVATVELTRRWATGVEVHGGPRAVIREGGE